MCSPSVSIQILASSASQRRKWRRKGLKWNFWKGIRKERCYQNVLQSIVTSPHTRAESQGPSGDSESARQKEAKFTLWSGERHAHGGTGWCFSWFSCWTAMLHSLMVEADFNDVKETSMFQNVYGILWVYRGIKRESWKDWMRRGNLWFVNNACLLVPSLPISLQELFSKHYWQQNKHKKWNFFREIIVWISLLVVLTIFDWICVVSWELIVKVMISLSKSEDSSNERDNHQ